MQLAERSKDLVEPLSGGMKRRLTIARALINEPQLLLLDEPTTGLDPQARHLVWDRLYRLKQRGTTLVLTTHYMDEAEQLCDRLVVMDQGRIVAEGSPRALIQEHATREVLELRFPPGDADVAAPDVAGIGDRTETLPDRILIYAHDGDSALGEVHRRGVGPWPAKARAAGPADSSIRASGRRAWRARATRPRGPLGVATSPGSRKCCIGYFDRRISEPRWTRSGTMSR